MSDPTRPQRIWLWIALVIVVLLGVSVALWGYPRPLGWVQGQRRSHDGHGYPSPAALLGSQGSSSGIAWSWSI